MKPQGIAVLVVSLCMTTAGWAATIPPEASMDGWFQTWGARDVSTVVTPEADVESALEASFFAFRESAKPTALKPPFTPRIPTVAVRDELTLSREDSLRLSRRR
ncbi:MAG: hypothetical protein IT163_21145 [Bryobacterales bacterium]|nr:hypothetical protein [Bryobacterales bacterium]